jgi:two-component system response regulator HydG
LGDWAIGLGWLKSAPFEVATDAPLMMEVFLWRHCALHGRDIPGFTPRAIRALLLYVLPGDIRERQNLVECGVIMADEGSAIDVRHLARSGELLETGSLSVSELGQWAKPDLVDGASNIRLGKIRAQGTRIGAAQRDPDLQTYRKALAAARYIVSKAAKILNLTRAQLAYRLKVAGIRWRIDRKAKKVTPFLRPAHTGLIPGLTDAAGSPQ